MPQLTLIADKLALVDPGGQLDLMPGEVGGAVGFALTGDQRFLGGIADQYAEDPFARCGVEHFAHTILLPAFDLHLGAAVFVGQHFHLGGGHQGAFVGLGAGIQIERGGGNGVTGGDVGRGLGRSLRQLAGTGGSQAAHVWHDVGDTAVAVDTGLALLDGDRVLGTGIGALGQNVHRLVAVAAAAGGGVVGFQLVPDRLGHTQLVGLVFLRGVEGADRLVIVHR